MNEGPLSRYRIQFQKGDLLRYIGHLDLHRTIERTLRRSKLPVDYSKGFNPRVKLNLSSALPLGCTSIAELADIWLLSDLKTSDVLEALRLAAPPGLSFHTVEQIDLKTPSLQSQINAVEYRAQIQAMGDTTSLVEAVRLILDSEELLRDRRGKRYDLRPLIQQLELCMDQSAPTRLRMILQVGEGTTGRPEEVLSALGIDPAEAHIERTQVFLEPTPSS